MNELHEQDELKETSVLSNPAVEGRVMLRKVGGFKNTGPVDDEINFDAGDCPECNKNTLWFYPEQYGQCYSGEFKTWMDEHYWCEDCESIFIDEQAI